MTHLPGFWGRLSYSLKTEVMENNHILTRPFVFSGRILDYNDNVLTKGKFLAFSREKTKDKLGNISGKRKTPRPPVTRKGDITESQQ